jgi:hypothetical protein
LYYQCRPVLTSPATQTYSLVNYDENNLSIKLQISSRSFCLESVTCNRTNKFPYINMTLEAGCFFHSQIVMLGLFDGWKLWFEVWFKSDFKLNKKILIYNLIDLNKSNLNLIKSILKSIFKWKMKLYCFCCYPLLDSYKKKNYLKKKKYCSGKKTQECLGNC